MTPALRRAAGGWLVACAACASYAHGAQPAGALDVPTPYLPSTTVAVEEMLRVADVKPTDLVVDLGSGDGRIPIAAARYFGARGYGVDIDAKLVDEANDNARKAGVADRVRFEQKDVFATDLGNATVVTLYLLTGLVNRLQPKLLKELKPGARIVAHDYGFEGWTPDRTVTISKTYYLYVVPAAVGGRWRLSAQLPGGERTFELDVKQDRQKVSGGARVAGGFLPLFDAALSGDRIRFVLVDEHRAHHFEGRVSGSLIEGTVRTGIGNAEASTPWRATRIVGAGEEG
jgi:SAM-dependent methyltransferase